jgi:hypothetical protein
MENIAESQKSWLLSSAQKLDQLEKTVDKVCHL